MRREDRRRLGVMTAGRHRGKGHRGIESRGWALYSRPRRSTSSLYPDEWENTLGGLSGRNHACPEQRACHTISGAGSELRAMAMMQQFFTSESVSMGHPDKVADQISDGVLDAMIADDPMSRVACETLCCTG